MTSTSQLCVWLLNGIKKDLMDTALITKIYMQRPQHYMALRLGQWFCNATGVINPNLFYAETQKSKEIMIQEGYTQIEDLTQKLTKYNQGN